MMDSTFDFLNSLMKWMQISLILPKLIKHQTIDVSHFIKKYFHLFHNFFLFIIIIILFPFFHWNLTTECKWNIKSVLPNLGCCLQTAHSEQSSFSFLWNHRLVLSTSVLRSSSPSAKQNILSIKECAQSYKTVC